MIGLFEWTFRGKPIVRIYQEEYEIFYIFRNKVAGQNQNAQDKTAMKVRPQEHDEGEGEEVK